MTRLTYAIVTPSYWKDVHRCALLIESIEKWVARDVPHYLVIARGDVHLFRPLLKPRSVLIVVEDIIPNWLFRVPGIRHFWISRHTRPVKNWILQQIVKLSMPGVVPEDVLLYADSDMFFVSPYDPRKYEQEGKVPLFLETGQLGMIPSNDLWQSVASKILGIPSDERFDVNFVGQLVCWRRSNALALLRRVEEQAGKEWTRVIAPLGSFSEYILYGIYVTRMLSDGNSGHWRDGTIRTHNYWLTTPLDIQALETFKDARESFQHSVMISSKSGTRVEDVRTVFFSSPGTGAGAA
jgi:hypothetical protein